MDIQTENVLLSNRRQLNLKHFAIKQGVTGDVMKGGDFVGVKEYAFAI